MHDDAQPSWPLKIGLLTHSVNPRGGVVHTLELAEALHAAGHAVTVFAPALEGQKMFRPVPFRLRLVPIEPHTGGTVGMVAMRIAAFEKCLSHLLIDEPFDVLHAQDPIGANALANLQDQFVIDGFVRTVHHLDNFEELQLMQWQARGMYAAREVLCVSKLWCDTLQREHGIQATQIHNGVNLARYSHTPHPADEELRARWGLRGGGDAPVVLAVGGIEERKNTVGILQAFALLKRQHPGAQLVIAGGSSLLNHDAYGREFQAQLQKLQLRTGVGADVVITGTLADAQMPSLFRCADVLAMPSLREGFGLVVLEALASGVPVVVSNIAPFTEYLTDADCCWADPNDSSSIAQALQAALRPERKRALRNTPRVCQRFSWTASATLHANLYREHHAHHAL
jgi:glycosyltransferase-like protein